MKPADYRINIGGFEAGIGIGYEFYEKRLLQHPFNRFHIGLSGWYFSLHLSLCP